MQIKRLNFSDSDFWQQLERKLAWEEVSDSKVNATVESIINAVRQQGDAAVVEFTNRFDAMSASSMQDLEIAADKLHAALEKIPEQQRQALEYAAKRVSDYHQHQKQDSWSYTEEDGTLLGQQVTALDRVGLYVPGGKAAYPSSVIMNAIPAKVWYRDSSQGRQSCRPR